MSIMGFIKQQKQKFQQQRNYKMEAQKIINKKVENRVCSVGAQGEGDHKAFEDRAAQNAARH